MRSASRDDRDAPGDSLTARAASLVNPASGLANDYLNIFNELIMLLEMAPDMPDMLDDIFGWRPKSYVDYFRSSDLPGGKAAVETYARIEPGFRNDFEAVVTVLMQIAQDHIATLRALAARGGAQSDAVRSFCPHAVDSLAHDLRRATNMVNYGRAASRIDPQRKADRLVRLATA